MGESKDKKRLYNAKLFFETWDFVQDEIRKAEKAGGEVPTVADVLESAVALARDPAMLEAARKRWEGEYAKCHAMLDRVLSDPVHSSGIKANLLWAVTYINNHPPGSK